MANIFPRWTNALPLKVLAGLVTIGALIFLAVWYYFTPKYSRVGYMPTQPVPYSHALHVGQLGMDCRYCHSQVENSGHANIPTAQTCMNCHASIQTANPRLALVRESFEKGTPIQWVRVHQLPDHVYFNHSVHVNRGISCVSCHGKINEMEVVYQAEPQSMGWCLQCHRNPENGLRPLDKITDLNWTPPPGKSQHDIGLHLKKEWKINPPTNCAGCHR